MANERCVLIRCSLPIYEDQSYVALPAGGKIHFDCLIDWRKNGGALMPSERHEEETHVG